MAREYRSALALEQAVKAAAKKSGQDVGGDACALGWQETIHARWTQGECQGRDGTQDPLRLHRRHAPGLLMPAGRLRLHFIR